MTFERWHESLNQLMEHNAEMHGQNQEFFNIVKQIVILALNAAIETARRENGAVLRWWPTKSVIWPCAARN